MNWIKNPKRHKLEISTRPRKKHLQNLWKKCRSCQKILLCSDLKKNMHVCHYCGYHHRISVIDRLNMIFDKHIFSRISLTQFLIDPLDYKDKKTYVERLIDARNKTGECEALLVAEGLLNSDKVIIAAFNFYFMGGSMGMAVGDGLIIAVQHAIAKRTPLIVITASGGARMQEGILSLMQMPRTVIAIQYLKKETLPYIVLLTDPTMGGVAASISMLGDVLLSEPRATVGFAGSRVTREVLTSNTADNFQTSEFLLKHGFIDIVSTRSEIKLLLSRLINLLMKKSC
jgi:acetyl-CoA carboxylase carboxyl transferase subunit beta